jgi:hypothetical protein
MSSYANAEKRTQSLKPINVSDIPQLFCHATTSIAYVNFHTKHFDM